VVVPVYNENPQVLKETLDPLLAVFKNVVVVDDGSLSDLKKELVRLPVYFLSHPINLGQGAALQTGTDFALRQGASFVVHFDADGQHLISDACQMLEAVQEGGLDIAMGSRFLGQKNEGMPWGRRVILQAGRAFNFLLTGLWLTDAHQGLRVLNRKAASTIRLQENRQAHATEILMEIKKHQLRYREFGVTTVYTQYSLAKGQKSWNAFTIFIDLVLNKIFK
jgi:glycosyltransferase involved in cell wall biosynthesis